MKFSSTSVVLFLAASCNYHDVHAFAPSRQTTTKPLLHRIPNQLYSKDSPTTLYATGDDSSNGVGPSASKTALFAERASAEPTSKSARRTTATTSVDEEDAGFPFLSGIQGKEVDEYTKGFAIIGFITLLNASCNPLWHAAFANGTGPPPLFLNAIIAVTALTGLVLGGPFLDSKVSTPKGMMPVEKAVEEGVVPMEELPSDENFFDSQAFTNIKGGAELGFWKFLGTTAHVYGMSLTLANHGAFLIQLTTLIVPVLQAIQGEKIPRQIQMAIVLALAGVVAFTQDPSGAASTSAAAQAQTLGDAMVVAGAFFYSLYDIQTFKWGRLVPRKELVTIKVGTQAALSVGLCAAVSSTDTMNFLTADSTVLSTLVPVVLWSGLIVNALATFLQVGGMQSVGPTRAQTIFASQPLWSAMLAYAVLGETIGFQGAMGGCAFLFALYLAATAPKEEAEDGA